MKQFSPTIALSALALAASVLVAACGGGDAEAPPPATTVTTPPAAPDTAAPTVVISDSVATGNANGEVTFTFTFSEDVGISFTADDVTVTNGTKGAFLRVGTTQSTLVVTPTPNATGMLGVALSAGAFRDLAGNASAAGYAAQQEFSTLQPGSTGTCTTAPCISFTGTAIGFAPFENGGGGTVSIEPDPVDATNRVARFVKKPGDGDFFGTVITGIGPVLLTPTAKTVTMRVLSPSAGTNMLLKLEGGAAGAAPTEIDVATTTSNQWETLSFVLPGTGTFSTVVLFPNGRSAVGADKTIYVDEIKFPALASAGGTASGSTGNCTTSACVSFSGTSITFSPFENSGGGSVDLDNDPKDAANRVAKFVKKTGDPDFFGTVINGTGSPVLAAGAKTIKLRVLSPTVGTNILLKLEGGPGGAVTELDQATTKADEWETLSFDMPATGTFTTVVVFPNGRSGVTADKTIYIDELTFPAVAGGGGGGGGGVACSAGSPSAPTCAPTTSIPAGSTVIYSDASSVAGIDTAPNWGQNPPVVSSQASIAGNNSLKYTFGAGALYQGIDWSGSPQNVTSKGTLHLDIWSADVASVKIFLIGGGGENGITKTLTAGAWTSIDIPLTDYTSPNLAAIVQMKLEPNVAGTIYVDNIYFHGTAAGGGGGGGGTFTGGIFASDYSGNLGANTAKSDKNGTVGFFVDPGLFGVKVFEDGSVAGSAVNPGGVPNFYYGVGKPATPTFPDAYFGGFVNAPGNTTADASAYAKIKLKFWGDAESWEKPNFTAQVDVILQGPSNAACTNPSGRPELTKAVAAQKIGAGSEYTIPKTDFVLTANCGGAYTANSVWAAVGAVVVRLTGSSNLNYVNLAPSTPPSYPTFINIGPISFIN